MPIFAQSFFIVMRLHKVFLTVSLALIANFAAWSKNLLEDEFSYENERFAGLSLNYRKAEMGDSAKIVVLYLHGGSGQGDDNKAQMKTPAINDVYSYLVDNAMNFTLLVPQAPYGQQWMGIAIPALKEMLDKYSDNGARDVYILGSSMGGLGTWNMLDAYPEYFKGAMPVAIDTPKGKSGKYLNTRICSVVGGNDHRRNMGKCKSFFEKFSQRGGQGKLAVEYRWGHRQTCELSFTPERLDWLFRPTKTTPNRDL